MEVQHFNNTDTQICNEPDDELPQCKIKRNYSCNHCSYFTQNPRFHLSHLRDVHGERIAINKCNLCLYASRHYQKLVRHMKMVHGSVEGIACQSRKRAMVEETPATQQEQKDFLPPIVPPLQDSVEFVAKSVDLSSALEKSRNALKELAVLYFAENEITATLSKMEAADAVLLAEIAMEDLSITAKKKPSGDSFLEEVKKSSIHEHDLKCPCGHVSKCFSETFTHRRTCNRLSDEKFLDQNSAEEGSTTCQHCASVCESSADLLNHLTTCLQYEIFQRSRCKTPPLSGSGGSESISIEQGSDGSGGIFNQSMFDDKSKEEGGSIVEKKEGDTADKVGVPPPETVKHATKEEETLGSSFRKVFKCPRCAFWASTASRFHVHIVGHMNKKPFKCSLCTYRSNWRWDITKHIRIKGIRNPSHKNARVLITDDAGRRNYTKYSRYLTVMKLSKEDGDSRLLKTGEMSEEQGNDLPTEKKFDGNGTEKAENDFIPDEKGTFYKCDMCPYRHNNRDVVLVHAKIYHSPPLPRQTSEEAFSRKPQSPNMNKVFAAAINLTQKKLFEGPKLPPGKNNDENPVLRGDISSANSLLKTNDVASATSQSGATQVNPKSLLPVSPVPSSGSPFTSESSCVGSIEMSKTLKDAISPSNLTKATPDSKGLSPFRCGHCHQVSNWKHVIQRHCRLKHSGDVQIEALNRSRDIGKSTYRPIDVVQQRRSQETTVERQQTPHSAGKFNSSVDIKTLHNRNDSRALVQDTQTKQLKTPEISGKTISSNKQIKSSFRQRTPQTKMGSNQKTSLLKISSSQTEPRGCGVDSKIAVRNNEEITESTAHTIQNSKCTEKTCQNTKRSEYSLPQEVKLKAPQVNKDCNRAFAQKDVTAANYPSCVVSPANTSTNQSIKSENIERTALLNNASGIRSSNAMRCPYCPFKNECSKTFHYHLQHHIRVSNSRAAHLCEHCDFSTSSRDEFNQHIRLHFGFLNNKVLTAFSTSFDKLELTVTENFQAGKKNDPIHFKSVRKSTKESQLKENTNSPKFRRSGSAQKIEKKPSPNVAEHRTILVNPKTGQVIRRN